MLLRLYVTLQVSHNLSISLLLLLLLLPIWCQLGDRVMSHRK